MRHTTVSSQICIVDGLGYADDGREIFDDNDEDEFHEPGGQKQQRRRPPVAKKSRLNPDIRPNEAGGSLRPAAGRDIRSLFAATAQTAAAKKTKQQRTTVSTGGDGAIVHVHCFILSPPLSLSIDRGLLQTWRRLIPIWKICWLSWSLLFPRQCSHEVVVVEHRRLRRKRW